MTGLKKALATPYYLHSNLNTPADSQADTAKPLQSPSYVLCEEGRSKFSDHSNAKSERSSLHN